MITTDALSRFDLFKGLSESLLAEIAALAQEVSVKQGEFIFREGEKADKLHFLLNGSVALRVKLTSRPESVTVSFVSMPYQSFGWSGIVAPNHYTSSAECDEDSNLLIIPAVPFRSYWKRIQNLVSRSCSALPKPSQTACETADRP